MMTPEQMNTERDDLRSYLSCTSLTVERCEHPSCDLTALWVFDQDGKQIASISRRDQRSKNPWLAQKIVQGQPVSNHWCERLLDAAGYVVRHC